MCDLCPRTPVTHVPGLYRSKLGHPAYPLLYRRRGHGAVALFVDNVDGALSVLNNAGHRVITESDLQDDDEYL